MNCDTWFSVFKNRLSTRSDRIASLTLQNFATMGSLWLRVWRVWRIRRVEKIFRPAHLSVIFTCGGSSQIYKCPMFSPPVNEWTFWLAVQTLVSQWSWPILPNRPILPILPNRSWVSDLMDNWISGISKRHVMGNRFQGYLDITDIRNLLISWVSDFTDIRISWIS